MPLLASLEAFLEVARHGNFGRAAAALGLTPSTLSRRVAALERELGCTLVRRSTRSFALTDSGKHLLERAEKILRDTAALRDELAAGASAIAGHLRIGAPTDLVIVLLAPVFARFCREHPGVSLDLVATQGQPDLLRDQLDVAFIVAHQVPLPNSSHTLHRIGSFARMPYASRRYLRRHGTPETPQQLAQHTAIRFLIQHPETHWDLRSGSRRASVPLHGACATTSVSVAAQAAREHLGIAMLPCHLADHPTFGAGLVRVLPDWQGTPAIIFAITAGRRLPARTSELIRRTRAQFGRRLAQVESVATPPQPASP